MAVIRKNIPMNLAGRIQLQIHHFARGTYPSDGNGSLPFNRFFMPLKNPAGRGCFLTDGRSKYEFVPGNAYFIPLNRPARLRLDDDLEFISIQFTLELYDGIDIFMCCNRIREIADPQWSARAAKIYQDQNDFAASVRLNSLVMDFASFLISDMRESDWRYVTRFSEFQRELDYIQSKNNALAKITVRELAKVRGLSRETFSRNFSRVTGISPKEFLNRLIVKKASHLLCGKGTLKEIAESLGFSSEFYFSRFFRKQTSMPPGQYRLSCQPHDL